MDHKTLLYAMAIILCANLHVTLFPQIIIILCQQPLHSSSLFLELASVPRTNNALRVCKQNHVSVYPEQRKSFSSTISSVVYVFFFVQFQGRRKDFCGTAWRNPLSPQTSGYMFFLLVLTSHQSGSYVCISLGAVSALTVRSCWALSALNFYK